MLLALTKQGNEYVFERPIRLLAVDDDPIMREFAASQLAQPGCSIVTAGDGEEAWAILEADGAGFDLVLSDLEMPRMNGFALVDQVRRSPRHARLPVVVITSREDMFAIDRAYEVGATSFVTKPVNWRLLGYQLRYIMRACRMEAEARAARDEARRSADLRESLLTLLQHETRTPLHGIIGFAELMRGGAGDPQTRAAHADHVVAAARSLNDTLQRIFYYAQASTGTLPLDREPASLSQLAQLAARAVRAKAAQAGVTLEVPEGGPGPDIACDLRHLCAALKELLDNAVAHSAAGGSVEVAFARRDGFAAVTIRDHGPGIPADALARCRSAFGQGGDPMTRSVEGLGLGLPLAQSIVERHGGTLELTSTVGEGTTARVLLPLLAGPAGHGEKPRANAA